MDDVTRSKEASDAMSTIRFFAVLAVVFLLAIPLAQAQTSGTITGTVTDASNAVVPGVKITALSKASGEKRETTSNHSGQYTFPFLPPDDYELEFRHDGFAIEV